MWTAYFGAMRLEGCRSVRRVPWYLHRSTGVRHRTSSSTHHTRVTRNTYRSLAQHARTTHTRVRGRLTPRSLYLLTKDARYKWLHGVVPVESSGTTPRVSITFRYMFSRLAPPSAATSTASSSDE